MVQLKLTVGSQRILKEWKEIGASENVKESFLFRTSAF